MEIGYHRTQIKKGQPVNLFFLGDIQEGNANVNERAIQRAINTIKDAKRDNPETYYILMGDLLDCIVSGTDKRFNPAEINRKYSIRDLKDFAHKQADYVLEYFGDIKEACLGAVIGNHEESFVKYNHADVYGYYSLAFPNCKKLGYVSSYQFQIDIKGEKGGSRTNIYLNHGTGGRGTTRGSVKNKMDKLFFMFPLADYAICGHYHLLEVDRVKRKFVDDELRLRDHYQLRGCSGTFLETFVPGNRSYAESKGGQAEDLGMLKATIKYERKRINGDRIRQTMRFLEPIYLEDSFQ